ncbi:MAG: glycine cleavage system protein H [Bacteroidales bacterium]|jgi:glycine cleavage system H protein|nr:glycine cleavage system protein H [Bacteroidales bacterium]
MDEFSYVNMFDTKGIEYIIIIAFLLLIIPFWKLLNRPLKTSGRGAGAASPLQASVAGVPQGLYFSDNHTWAHMLRSGEARIGVDRLLVNLTGEVSLNILKESGTRVKKGEELSELVRDGKRLTVVSPVSGTVTGVNHELLDDASILSEDPYGKGWICSVKPENWLMDVAGSHFAADATAWLRRELERTRDFLAGAAARLTPGSHSVYLQDGGEPAGEPLASMPAEVWDDFQKEFLK